MEYSKILRFKTHSKFNYVKSYRLTVKRLIVSATYINGACYYTPHANKMKYFNHQTDIPELKHRKKMQS